MARRPPIRTRLAQQLDSLTAVALAGRNFAQAVRASLPVEGEAWTFEGLRDDPGAVVAVMNAGIELDRLLYPDGVAWDAGFFVGRRYRTSTLAPNRIIGPDVRWQPFYPAVQAVMHCHDRILQHYGWGEWAAERAGKLWGWTWPDVPRIPASLPGGLERGAGELRRLVDLCREELTNQRALPMLNENQQQALNFIKEHGPVGGKEVVTHVDVSFEHFRRWVGNRGVLTAHGVKNSRSAGGYYWQPV
jgi:hypothetical protein